MGLLLFIVLGGYLLATRIHQSAVIGEIFVGLVVGSSVLGLITITLTSYKVFNDMSLTRAVFYVDYQCV